MPVAHMHAADAAVPDFGHLRAADAGGLHRQIFKDGVCNLTVWLAGCMCAKYWTLDGFLLELRPFGG